ncbi:MAG: ferrous iron transport protein A [Succiniclasticum sp.]|nr:ferrous iron transport protein A [Succiniclasticum sp.]MCI6223057.1 ferrous iron transport protein A [Selenomonadales bacterium]MDY2870358.1 FeoA family protein [Succiniclasticum sp.]MDY6302873.1 FeoA family protein [Succiniclasticum sp.]MDY6346288.1 FeoA family protein [Succiniclasticum sp.]
MIPLMMAEVGETVVIRKITGNDQVRQHLAEMGFTVDAKVTVVSHLAGNMILNVRDSRVGIGEAMARRILY